MAGTPPWKKYAKGRKFTIQRRRPLYGRQRDAHVRAYVRRRNDLRDLMRAWWMVRRHLVTGKLPPRPRK